MSRPSPARTNATPTAVTATEAPIDKPPPPPVNLPPLDQMDGFLRPLLSALSSRPELAKWLATDDLVRQLAAAIDQASAGASPARDFKVIAPASRVRAGGPRQRAARSIRPAIGATTGWCRPSPSIDASNVAKIYKTIRPRLNEAYQSMGNPNGDVDRALQQTLDILLDTPVVKDPIALVEGDGAGWAYADRRTRGARADAEAIAADGIRRTSIGCWSGCARCKPRSVTA